MRRKKRKFQNQRIPNVKKMDKKRKLNGEYNGVPMKGRGKSNKKRKRENAERIRIGCWRLGERMEIFLPFLFQKIGVAFLDWLDPHGVSNWLKSQGTESEQTLQGTL